MFWHETLPRNANGKILKNELKKLLPRRAKGPRPNKLRSSQRELG